MFPEAGDRGRGSQPAVVRRTLYVGWGDGQIYALDARTGETLWVSDAAASAGASVYTGPAVADGRVISVTARELCMRSMPAPGARCGPCGWGRTRRPTSAARRSCSRGTSTWESPAVKRPRQEMLRTHAARRAASSSRSAWPRATCAGDGIRCRRPSAPEAGPAARTSTSPPVPGSGAARRSTRFRGPCSTGPGTTLPGPAGTTTRSSRWTPTPAHCAGGSR